MAMQAAANIQDFDDHLYELIGRKKLIDIINLKNDSNLEKRSRFLWAWPTLDTLECLKKYLEKINITKLLSVGCGSGLLEWLVQEYCGIEVYGLELDQSWWSSMYAPQKFIHLNFTTCDSLTDSFLYNICNANRCNEFVLFFCYFNNGDAFRSYIKNYTGDYVIIIGPIRGSFIYTDPEPFHPCFSENQWENDKWQLDCATQIDNSCNYMTMWKKHYDRH